MFGLLEQYPVINAPTIYAFLRSCDHAPEAPETRAQYVDQLVSLGFSYLQAQSLIARNIYPYGHNLSKGEIRRIALLGLSLATNLQTNLLLDEPTAGLDRHSASKVCDFVNALSQRQSVIVSTHDVSLQWRSDSVISL
jgi:ABC-type transport system involved in cytochrome bd biosynthesis fused ATPase/permease subunit